MVGVEKACDIVVDARLFLRTKRDGANAFRAGHHAQYVSCEKHKGRLVGVVVLISVTLDDRQNLWVRQVAG